jgi:murein DD-endopeptidase MepM/ murein hydrolase activator NlpD
MTLLDEIAKTRADLQRAELGLTAALDIIFKVRDDLESWERSLAPHNDPRWLLFPLDIAWPVSGEFGITYTIGGVTWQHEGIDIACPTRCGVRACASGVVKFAGTWRGYGNYVQLDHQHGGATWRTAYGHLDRIDVVPGQAVIAHDTLGSSGATGNVTGAHLHLTVWDPASTFQPVGCTAYLRGVRNPRECVQWP